MLVGPLDSQREAAPNLIKLYITGNSLGAMAAFKLGLVAIVAVCMVAHPLVITVRAAVSATAPLPARAHALTAESANSNREGAEPNATHTRVPEQDDHVHLRARRQSAGQAFSGYNYIGNGGCRAGNTQPNRFYASGAVTAAVCINACSSFAICAGCHFVLGSRCELFGNRFTSSPMNGPVNLKSLLHRSFFGFFVKFGCWLFPSKYDVQGSQNLELRCVLVPAPWRWGQKCVSKSRIMITKFNPHCARVGLRVGSCVKLLDSGF